MAADERGTSTEGDATVWSLLLLLWVVSVLRMINALYRGTTRHVQATTAALAAVATITGIVAYYLKRKTD